jgi:hypothetical protein
VHGAEHTRITVVVSMIPKWENMLFRASADAGTKADEKPRPAGFMEKPWAKFTAKPTTILPL